MRAGHTGSVFDLEVLRSEVRRRESGWAAKGLDVTLSDSPTDRDKRSSWVTVHGPAGEGVLIVWDSGEAEEETLTTARHHDGMTTAEMLAALDRVALAALGS